MEVYSASTPTILFSGYDHVIFATFALEDEGVAEVFPAVTVIAAEQEESTIFVPRLEIGRNWPASQPVSAVSGIIYNILYWFHHRIYNQYLRPHQVHLPFKWDKFTQ